MKKLLLIGIVLFSFSCEPRQGKQAVEIPVSDKTSLREVVVEEVLQATNYTYVRAMEEDKEIWMAIMKADIDVGKTYYYEDAMEMKDFESKDLDRHFESVYFLGGLFESPDDFTKSGMTAPNDPMHGKKEAITKEDVTIEMEEGITSIEHLYHNKSKLDKSSVVVQGVVTKYNPNIMNKNWVHIQDGTGDNEHFDLTITTQDEVKVGSMVKFEGIVAIDKDFGHGYEYELILEEARQMNKKPEVKVN